MVFDYLRVLGRRRSTRTALVIGTVMALAATSMALADEHEPSGEDPAPLVEEQGAEDPAPIEGRPEDGTIVFSLPDEFGDYADCSEAGVDGEAVVEGEASIEGEETIEGEEPTILDATEELLPDENGCYIVPALGPNDQWNHGQAVSAYVHAIKYLLKSDTFEGLYDDVPFGQMVRNAAHSDIGKEADDGDGLLLDPTTTETSDDGHPGKGKGHGNGKSKTKGGR